METINCIFCKTQQEDRVLIEENGFTGRKCERCGLVYISPRPSLSEIENLYTHDQAQISAESHKSQSFIKRVYARHHLAILRRHISKGSLLEIGAGAGFFLAEAQKRGFESYGIEWNDRQRDFIRNELAIQCEAGSLVDAFKNECFDIIYHCDVVSHFYDPIAEFTTANQRLHPGGILMFETGNGDFQEKYLSAFTSFQYPDHLFFFSEKNIRDLLASTGFELLQIYKWSILPQLTGKRFFSKFTPIQKLNSKDRELPAQAIQESFRVKSSQQLARKSAVKTMILSTLVRFAEILSYILRYKVGYIYPKDKRPYTMIVVARKSTT